MTSLAHLLPAADEAPRCTDHSQAIGLDPGGTAIRADRLVLVATTRPWPKPALDHPTLAGIGPVLALSARPTRLLAAVPGHDAPPDHHHGGSTEVITFDRTIGGPGIEVIERRFTVSTDRALGDLAAILAADDLARLDREAVSRAVLVGPVALICTQGSHDVCCGSEGARLASEAEAAGIDVYRVSHTGGHRFAPTALTLPDGRMWADLDLDLLRQIFRRTGDSADLVSRCRGWWGADPGPAQVAERAVFAAAGWEFEDQARTVEPIEPTEPTEPVERIERIEPTEPIERTDPGTDRPAGARYAITVGQGRWEVVVVPGREVPTIACRQPGGLPVKRAREYVVDRVIGPPSPG